jgi:hypothetical protein
MWIFTKWFDRRVKDAWMRAQHQSRVEAEQDTKYSTKHLLVSGGFANQRLEREGAMSFRVHRAENGHVIEVHGFDERTDRSWSKLHLIQNNEDFDQSLCHIMTISALRN